MRDSAQAPRRLAAVVVPIFAGAPHDVVFVERATHLRNHAGQIAFPGGALEPGDEGDLARAGLRELHEEVGIPPAAADIVGKLNIIHQTRNIFDVTPFVAVVAAGTPLVVDLNEASAAHRVPLAAILAPGAVHTGIEVVGDRRIDTTVFDYNGMHVWGLTGHVLAMLVRRYGRAGSPLRTAIDERLEP